VGVSAGSMVVTHSLHVNREELEKSGIYNDDEYDEVAPPNAGSDKTLKLVDFVIRPHLNSEDFPKVTLVHFETSASRIDVPMYVIDDQTAIKVVDSDVRVISEGVWKLFKK
jgi:dipeptidase E